MTKICKKCGLEKDTSEFNFKDKSKNRLNCNCKACVILSRVGKPRKKQPYTPEKAEYNRQYQAKNKEAIATQRAGYYQDKKEYFYETNAKYRQEHKEELKISKAEYHAKNSKEINKKRYQRHLKQLENDPAYRLRRGLRNRLSAALRGKFKAGSAVRDLGCTGEELKIYLENKFYPNPRTGEAMTWDNWAPKGWHIDHIKPLINFDLNNREEFLKANHYTNLQPLWWFENLEKSDK